MAGCTSGADDSVVANESLVTEPAPFTVTFIGDSHADHEGNAHGTFGYLGEHLKELMASRRVPFSLYAASGSSPMWWFDETSTQAATWGYSQTAATPSRRRCYRGHQEGTCVPKLGVLLSPRPSLFVIEQGTNLLGRSTSDIANQVRTMISETSGKADACLWVAAPNARASVHSQASQDQLWQIIRANASPSCFVYDSRFLPRTDGSGRPVLDVHGDPIIDVPLPYSPGAGNDGEHLGMQAAGKWAEGVALVIDILRERAHRAPASESDPTSSDH
jgi:hypothetical protein